MALFFFLKIKLCFEAWLFVKLTRAGGSPIIDCGIRSEWKQNIRRHILLLLLLLFQPE